MLTIIYFTGFGLVMAFGCLEVGSRASDLEPTDYKEESLINYFVAGAMWPVILLAVLIALPFHGLYRLGRVLRSLR